MTLSIGGIILCGGQSKRMGQPKAWLPFGDELMLPRIVRILTEVCQPIVVVAAPDQDLPPLPAETILVRDEKPDQGPLQGLAAGLSALQGHAKGAYVSSCDVPLLQPTFIRRMVELLEAHAIAVPWVEERYHPLAAVYRLEVLPHVQRLLDQGRMRPMFLFEECDTRIVTEEELVQGDADLKSLRNLNTPEDYQKAQKEI